MAATIEKNGKIRFNLKGDEAWIVRQSIHKALINSGEIEPAIFWLLIETVNCFLTNGTPSLKTFVLRKSAFFAVFSDAVMCHIDVPTQIVIKDRIKLEEVSGFLKKKA